MTRADTIDPGSEDDVPVEELKGLEQAEVSPGMALRVHRAIERRLLINKVAEFSWLAPVHVLKQFLQAGFQLFTGGARAGSKEDTDG